MKKTARHRSNVVRYYVAAAMGTALAAVPAFAQDQGDTLEEVIVTAQKREQNVQKVPIAITAFTAESLQQKDVGEVGALTRFAPNVNLDTGSPFSGDTSVLSASIRGIGQDDFAFNLDPGVGVYVDGVYLARTIGANQSLLDIDRIEILKGPQGTLFGRNTIGGAISIVTHTPGTEKRFLASATTGSFNRQDISLTADFPVSESFLTTLSFSSQVRDGYQKVIPFPTDTELGQVPWVVDPQTRVPQGGLRDLGHQGWAESAGDPRQGAVEGQRQFQRDHFGRLLAPEPVVVSDHGARSVHAGGRQPADSLRCLAATGTRRSAAAPGFRLHGCAVQLLHQHAGRTAQRSG